MVPAHEWSAVPESHRWVIDAMNERLDATELTTEELRARAQDLRAEARDSTIDAFRNAALSLAERYEQTASRLASA